MTLIIAQGPVAKEASLGDLQQTRVHVEGSSVNLNCHWKIADAVPSECRLVHTVGQRIRDCVAVSVASGC